MKKTFYTFCCLTGLGVALFAQTTKPLTDKDVISLVKTGIPAPIIVAKIRQSATAFNTNTKALEKLKAAGVPESVMLAMVYAPSATKATKSSSAIIQPVNSSIPAILQTTKPVVIVQEFKVRRGIPWPYDPRQIQYHTIAELLRKDGKRFEVVKNANPDQPRLYTLHGEILAWRPGNRAMRMIVGFGTGRETAKIRYWLTNDSGKPIFKHTDTIRSSFWASSGGTGSAGTLGEPLADKIAARLTKAKLP